MQVEAAEGLRQRRGDPVTAERRTTGPERAQSSPPRQSPKVSVGELAALRDELAQVKSDLMNYREKSREPSLSRVSRSRSESVERPTSGPIVGHSN